MTQYCNLGLNVYQLMGEMNLANTCTTMLKHLKRKYCGVSGFTLDTAVWQNAAGWFKYMGGSLPGPFVTCWEPLLISLQKDDATNMLVYSRLFFLIDGSNKSSKQPGSWRPARISRKFKLASLVYFYSPPKCNIIIRITQISS